MGDHTQQRLLQLATAFRDAIERADRSCLGITLANFPRGSCGDASLLLGHFLKEHGFTEVTYVLGERGHAGADWTSHAWLRVEGYIVDITADQFSEVDQRVIVAQRSPWYETFKIEDERHGDFTAYDTSTAANLAHIYAVIAEQLC